MEYFINKHNTYCKELNFNFPEHQNKLKSIKKIDEKIEKIWNILEKNEIFKRNDWDFQKSEIFDFQYDFQ